MTPSRNPIRNPGGLTHVDHHRDLRDGIAAAPEALFEIEIVERIVPADAGEMDPAQETQAESVAAAAPWTQGASSQGDGADVFLFNDASTAQEPAARTFQHQDDRGQDDRADDATLYD